MMRRQFDQAYKDEAVRLAARGDQSMHAVAQKLGISPELLRRWRRQVEARSRGAARPAAPAPPRSVDEELRLLRREVAQLREEREIIKKAAAFFAREVR